MCFLFVLHFLVWITLLAGQAPLINYPIHIAVVVLEDANNNSMLLEAEDRDKIVDMFKIRLSKELVEIKDLEMLYNISASFSWTNISSGIDNTIEDLSCNIFSKSNVIFLIPYKYLYWTQNYRNTALLIFRLITLYAEERHIPVISWIPELKRGYSEKDIPYLVSLYPMMESYSSATASFISKSSRLVFYEITCGVISPVMSKFTQHLYKELDSMTSKWIQRIWIDSNVVLDIVGKLVDLIHNDFQLAVFVNCETEQWSKVIEAIELLKISGEKYQFFLTSSMLNFMENISIPQNAISLYFDKEKLPIKEKLEIALDVLLSTLLELKNKTALLPLPEVTDCHNQSSWSNGRLLYKTLLASQPADHFEIMRFRNSSWEKIGGWSEQREVYLFKSWLNHSITMDQNQDDPMSFNRLKIVTKEEEPFITFNENKLGKQCSVGVPCFIYQKQNSTGNIHYCCTGFLIDLLIELSKELYFSFDLYRVKDGKWGGLNHKGHWVGIVGELIRKEADVALTSLKIDKARQKVLDFSAPLMETGIGILVRKKHGIVSASAFLEPFDVSAWLMICLCLLPLVAFAIFIFEWLSPYGYNQDYSNPRDSKMTFCGVIWVVWDLLLNNLVPSDHPKGVTSRILVNVWACFALVFLSSYTANLAAYMIQEVKVDEISGLNDNKLRNPYSHKPIYKFGTIPLGSTELLIKNKYPFMYEYMKSFGQKSVASALENLRNGSLDAFIYDAAALDFQVGNDKNCVLETVGKWSAMTGYGIAFPKGSPLTDNFDKALIKLHHAGIINHFRQVWFVGACRKTQKPETLSHPLGIQNVMGTVYLLLAGLLLSLVIFLCENIFNLKKKKSTINFKIRPDMLSLVSMGMMRSLDSTYELANLERRYHIECQNMKCNQRSKEHEEYIMKLEKTIQNIISERLEEEKTNPSSLTLMKDDLM